MKTDYQMSIDQMNNSLVRARQLRSKYMANLVKSAGHRLHRAVTKPDAEHRRLAKSAIAPITAGSQHNRSSVNPLMVRGLAIS